MDERLKELEERSKESTSRKTKTIDQRTKAVQLKKQSGKHYLQQHKNRSLATDAKTIYITAWSEGPMRV